MKNQFKELLNKYGHLEEQNSLLEGYSVGDTYVILYPNMLSIATPAHSLIAEYSQSSLIELKSLIGVPL